LVSFNLLFEFLQGVFPARFESGNPRFHIPQRGGVQALNAFPAGAADGNQPGHTENAQMLDDGGTADPELFHDATDRQIFFGQQIENLPSPGIGNGFDDRSDSGAAEF
jgi:hypothetical protein